MTADYRELIRKGVTVVAVSKNQPVPKILELYNQGCRDFGESRVQEWELKKKVLPDDIVWHFIGTLQKNKAQKVVGHVGLIHSVDSLELAERISMLSVKKNIVSKILLEVNTSGESTKHGFFENELAIEAIKNLPGISVEGLMTMAANTEDEEKIRASFRKLRELKEKYALKELSMGMSHDYRIAIEEGATIIRVGSLLFGD